MQAEPQTRAPQQQHLRRPPSVKRILRKPGWVIDDLAPMRRELRHPARYVTGVRMWKQIRQAGFTMLGCRRARTLYRLAAVVEQDAVPGAFVDCGCRNGGSTAMLSAGGPTREVYAFDSFEGLPEPGPQDAPGTSAGSFVGAEENVHEAMRRWGRPERLHIRKGWFEDTFPMAAGEIGPIAIIHADGDWYESIRLTLETFYDQVSRGGFVVVDDWTAYAGARRAVEEFRADRGIEDPLVMVSDAVYWRKSASRSFAGANRTP